MAERIEWLDDGTASGAPFSPGFGDRYRGELGGSNRTSQARDVFLAGCGLPAAWSGQPSWKILEIGFGLGLNFLVIASVARQSWVQAVWLRVSPSALTRLSIWAGVEMKGGAS